MIDQRRCTSFQRILSSLNIAFASAVFVLGQPTATPTVDHFAGHPRVAILSDIGNEPDDQMSLVRLLVYSNQLDLEALVATTSVWQKNVVHPERCAC